MWMCKGHFRQGSKEEGPMILSILLVKSFKLVPRSLDKSPKQIKLWFSLHDIILEGKPIGPDQKKEHNGELMD
jgi:hypothetical protein